jgi:hypothetical protein
MFPVTLVFARRVNSRLADVLTQSSPAQRVAPFIRCDVCVPHSLSGTIPTSCFGGSQNVRQRKASEASFTAECYSFESGCERPRQSKQIGSAIAAASKRQVCGQFQEEMKEHSMSKTNSYQMTKEGGQGTSKLTDQSKPPPKK